MYYRPPQPWFGLSVLILIFGLTFGSIIWYGFPVAAQTPSGIVAAYAFDEE